MADHPGPELEARYANSFEIGFNAYEFVIDFAQRYEQDSGRSVTRVVTSPALARRLAELLEGSLRQYEARYGEAGPVK
jgi:hypothetical protein